ncbi:hypothetical protein ACFX2I_002929 [Malus domestica]
MIEISNVLQEIKTQKLRDFIPQNGVVCFGGIGVGVSASKGKKKFMEDTHKIVSCLQGQKSKKRGMQSETEQGGMQSETEQVPPESESMEEVLLMRMLAMVRNVAVPARGSVEKLWCDDEGSLAVVLESFP